MIKQILISCSVLIIGTAQAQQFTQVSATQNELIVSFDLKEKTNQFTTINGVNFVDFSKMYQVLSHEKGAPALPEFHQTIQLPQKGNPTIQLTNSTFVEYANIEVLPSKGTLKRNIDPSSIPYSFGSVYLQNSFYPSVIVDKENPFAWRSLRGMVLDISPIQYNPLTKVLRVYSHIELKVSYNEQVNGINELNGSTDPVLKSLQNRMVLNPVFEKYTPKEETGTMLVIAPVAYTEEITPFVNWKNQKGIRTELVSTDITGTTDAAILAYIQNYYATHPDLLFLLLVGDDSSIPSHTYGMSGGENLYSDSYYGQLVGSDYYPELFVGRFSGSESQVTTMVTRTLEYEKTPAAGAWMENAIGLGSNEGTGIGNDGEADWQHLRNIRTKLMNYGYNSVYEFYDSSHGGDDAAGNPNSTIILPAVNSGVGLFNYTGHGDVNLCVTGNFTSNNINSATNNGMYPFVISVACNNGTFINQTCISETWLRASNNGSPTGAIAAAGSSILMAWAEPMQTQDEMTELIAETYPTNHKTLLGGLFYNSQMSMLENYPSGNGIEVMQTWVLFGDPSAQFRNKETMAMVINAPGNISQTTTSIQVNCDVEGALVAISQNNILLGYGTVVGGVVIISIPTLVNNDYLVVTATKQNYATQQRSIQVGNGPLGLTSLAMDFMCFPNPVTDLITIKTTVNLDNAEIMIYASTGAIVETFQLADSKATIPVGHLAKGTYFIKIKTDAGVSTQTFVKK